MPDMRYAAGMDGGGTKTVLEARAPDGRVLLRERFGPLNLNSAAAQAVRETMQGCTDALARLPGGLEACAALCVGSAGVSNPQARALLEQMLRRCGYRGALLLTGDQETALAGALGAPCGMVLIAGTGSICFGRDAEVKQPEAAATGIKSTTRAAAMRSAETLWRPLCGRRTAVGRGRCSRTWCLHS